MMRRSQAVAATPTPSLDAQLRRLTGWANNSKLWLVIAAGLFALGGGPAGGPPSRGWQPSA
jgi:hypothetical protein